MTSYIYLAEERVDRARRGEREAERVERGNFLFASFTDPCALFMIKFIIILLVKDHLCVHRSGVGGFAASQGLLTYKLYLAV
jgi:hypothetical protein